MRAAVFHGPHDIRVEDVPEPVIAADEVLVEVTACGFCGSDVEYYTGKSPVGTADGTGPLILGHELAGRIVALGTIAGSSGLREGDRVAVCPIQSCGACDPCRAGRPQACANLAVLGVTTNGGFAQLARTRAAHAYRLPDTLTDEQGAFVEMLAAAVNAVRKAEVQPGDLAVVYGPGPVGLALIQLLRHAGARVAVVGTQGSRLEVARQLGAEVVLEAGEDLVERLRDATDGRLADRVIVATPSMAANQQALEVSAPGSTIVYMAVTGPDDAVRVPMLASLVQERTIRFSLWYPFQWPRTIELLARGIVDTGPIITHTAPLDGIGAAIDRVVRRDEGVIKTLIRP